MILPHSFVQEWEVRSQSHQTLMHSIKQPFKSIVETPGFSGNKQLQENGESARFNLLFHSDSWSNQWFGPGGLK